VYAVDVGKNQLHHSLRSDPRVTVMEGVNARYLKYEMIGEFLEIATIDVSFISIKKIIPRVCEVIKPGGFILALVKPQFEVGRFEVGKNGIVRNHEAIRRVLREMKEFGENLNLLFKGELVAPKEKEKKNTEYFLLWEK
jgi:23S rRNA (cytidine1920-2'-O)/16S rRNA (cytidine1409-2'-O)-methyltransferase